MEIGIHENTGFAYHGFGGLQQILHRKNQRIEFYKLQGLNQARKLLGKAAALSEQKRLLMAISSGETKHLDRVISIGLRQRKGVRGLLASVMAAAQGHYQPKSYSEEEDMKALLIWKLSGNRVAEINHRVLGALSVLYLRTRSTVPQIIPSHGRPELHQVKSNIEATITSILDEIHQIRRGRVLHTVVMFDELATEKRIRWDPKTNNFLGLCREHAHRTSSQFINEGDLEELFEQIDDGNVHYAGEVRLFQFTLICFHLILNILAPSGTLLFDIPLATDDIDESTEFAVPSTDCAEFPMPQPSTNPATSNPVDTEAIEARIEVEDALLELAPQIIEPTVMMHGKQISKARALSDFSKFRKRVGLTDRLRRVQDIERHVQNKTVSGNIPDSFRMLPADKEDILMVSDPIATLLSLDQKIWLCLGEINSLKVDNRPVTYLSLDMLSEEMVTVSYQVLGLRPATEDDDPEKIHDWRTYRHMDKFSFTVPGRLIQPLNPSTSKTHLPGQIPWYLFQSTILVALAASLMEQLTVSQLTSVPKVAATKEYPYRETAGENFNSTRNNNHTALIYLTENSIGNACFVCKDNNNFIDDGTAECLLCSPTVMLDLSHGQRVLEHMGAHILHDSSIIHSEMPLCGLCLRTAAQC